MKKNIFIITLLFNFLFPLGLKALIIPQSAVALACSNTGIADDLIPEINPAALSSMRPYIGFSYNEWFCLGPLLIW